MGLRNAYPFTFKAVGVCDAIDASNAPAGAMASLQNLIPNFKNLQQFVPRPASVQITNFSGFTTPTKVNAMIAIGTRVYGMIASSRFVGKDEPFCYDQSTGAFITLANVVTGNCPLSPATSGDWTPPIMCQVGKRILITHPGFSGANKFAWIDLRGFTSSTITGDTHTNTLIDNLSSNPINAGVAVGDRVTGTNIPANTFVVSMTATTITLSQATTGTTGGVTLTFASGTSAAPIYGAGDTNTNNLLSVPVAVAQFNGRAWFAVGNTVVFTDSLKPWVVTNATQSLTLGDDTAVTAFGGLPLSSQVVGGNVQSLIAFKGAAAYYQITGDQATSDLKSDQVFGSVGTKAPLTISPTPKGLAYVAVDGLRIIDPITGRPSEPIGANGIGITLPFISALTPSRMCGAFNQNIYRVAVKNGSIDSQATQEFWYHYSLGIWTGPHSFPAAIIVPYYGGSSDFILAATGVDAKLFETTVLPSPTSTYTENGSALTWMWTTSLLPDNQTGNSNQIVESSLGLVLPATQTFNILATDEAGNALNTITMTGDGTGSAIWGAFVWGGTDWGGSVPPFRQYTLNWTNPLVFKQAQVTCFGASLTGFTIGNLIAMIQPTGYQGAHNP